MEEAPFLVATRLEGEMPKAPAANKDGESDSSMLPASLLEVSMPLYFKAKKDQPYLYAVQFADVSEAILSIGRAEATQYFASTDFMKDLEADSLDAVEIILGVEEEYGIEIPDDIAENFTKVGDIVKYVDANK